ncbi:MAG: hypothetical protein JWN25_1650 [Verrucomicrobiales bacterium]|nr:hypothetical protein [Verrucomicrobiales bacterium]
MKQNNANNPSGPDFERVREKIITGVHHSQNRLRWLTRAGTTFGFVAILFSFMLITAYFLLFLPKQRHSEQLYGAMTTHATSATTNEVTAAREGKQVIDLPFVELQMIKVVSFGVMVVAFATGVLAVGVLVTLAVVVKGRRASLEEIKASLAEMSQSLKSINPGTQ